MMESERSLENRAGRRENKRIGRQVINKRPVAEYEYENEDGSLVFTIVRFETHYSDGSMSKEFRSKRRLRAGEQPNADGWVYNLEGAGLVPYNLRTVASAELIYVVEGERDVETLRTVGLPATCNPFGAGKWKAEFGRWFQDETVVILPDNDEPGKRHAETVAKMLTGTAKEIFIVELPGIPEKGDVSDFIANGANADDLIDLVKRAEPWQPSSQLSNSSRSKFAFTPLDKLLDEPAEDVSFIWRDTLPTGGFSICSAKPKVGRSTLARNLALAVANGRPFLGRDTIKGQVLYLCLEEKRSEIRKHFELLGSSSGNILIHTGGTPDNAIIEIATAIAEFDPKLIVIDPLSRVLRARDFNDYGLVSRELEPIVDLARRSGCHVLALHHDSKLDRGGGDALLGSTALFGAVDCHIQLKKRDGRRTLSTTQRYGEDFPETLVQLNKATGEIVSSGSLKDMIHERAKNAILKHLGNGEELDEPALKELVEGFNFGAIAKALRDLVDSGIVSRSGKWAKGQPYVYKAA